MDWRKTAPGTDRALWPLQQNRGGLPPAYATSSTSTRLFFVWPSKRLSTNSDNHVVLGLADTSGLHFMDGYLIAILVSDYLLTFLCTDEE
ncbi:MULTISPECIES: hypothetical protein [Rhodococcus]|uniref:hypothetical protein n=1 Tax=Rhodococcus TaxID=1827 RepID=UPI00067EAD68|nr:MULTISPECIES: hypothetical protein [Rhodococcus]MEA1797982.1 hypothetical protein [Rhodococcus qingshengii]